MTEEMIKQIKRLLFDYTEVYDDEPIIQGLQLLIKDNYISKDKIKDNIKELEILKITSFANNEISKQVYKEQIDLINMQINVLKNLLEER